MPVRDLNDMLAAIEGLAIETPAGRVIPLTDVRRLMLEDQVESAVGPQEEPPRNIEEARQRAKEHLRGAFGEPPPTVGRALEAQPQPSSRT